MKRYSPAEATAYLEQVHGIRRAPRTLANLRYSGKGPSYVRISPKEVLYTERDLDNWAGKLTAGCYRSTAEELRKS